MNVLVALSADCPEHNCSYKTKREGNIKEHRADVHGIGAPVSGGRTWRTCGVGVCVYKTNMLSSLKNHKAAIHNIDAVWHYCRELGCEYWYRAKQKGTIKQHRADVHDIGVTWHSDREHGVHSLVDLVPRDINVIVVQCIRLGLVVAPTY